MKRIFLIIAVLFSLLFVSLWTYVQSDAFAVRIRPLIAQPLQQILGPGAGIGRIKASLLPLYLEVRDITVPSSGSREALAIRRIRIYLNPLPLVYRTVAVPSLTLLEPRIAAKRAIDGTIDLTELVERIKANIDGMKRPGGSSYDVQVRTVTVRNGKAVVADAGTKSTVTLSQMNLKLKLSMPGSAMNVRLTSMNVGLSVPDYRDIEAKATGVVGYEQGKLTVESCELVSEDTRLALSGTAGLTPDAGMDLKLTSRIGQRSLGRIAELLKREKKAKGPVIETSARITGTVREPVMTGSISLTGIGYQGIGLRDARARFDYRNRTFTLSGEQWKLTKGSQQVTVREAAIEASYRGSVLEVSRAVVRADDADVSATGVIDPAKGYRLEIALGSAGSGRALALLAGLDVSGSASVRGTLNGPLNAPRFEGQLTAGPVTIRGVAFKSVAGDLVLQDRIFSLSDAEIRHGISRYGFNGSVNLQGPEPVYQARLGIQRSDVVSIVNLFYKPALPLKLSATGELSFQGTSKEFAGRGHLDVEAGAAYGESFDRGSLTVELTSKRITFTSVVLEKKAGTVSGTGWIGFDGTYDAQVRSTGLDLSDMAHLRNLSCSGPFTLDISSSGSFSSPTVQARGDVERLVYREASLGRVRVDLEIANAVLSIAVTGNDKTFTANGSWKLKQPYPWNLDANVKMAELEPATLFGGGDVLAKVRVTAEGSIKARGNGLDLASLNGSARLGKLEFTFGDLRIANNGDADILLEEGRVVVRSLALAGPGTRLSVTGGTRLGKDIDLSFTGDASLSLLRLLYREIEHGDGTASVRLTVSDDWSNPDVAGELTVRNGLIKIRDITQKFTALNGTINFDRNRIVTDGISGEVGGGTITVSGSAQLQGSALVDFSTKAAIENVTVRYPAGLTATVGGLLYFDGDPKTQTLSGEVAIRRAKYEKRVEWKSMLVDFSKGFTPKKKTDIGWIGETQINVRFLGRENIVFESNLAKIPLDIDMLFQGTVNQPQILGRVVARKGEVYFRKNVFRILHASADFTDPNRINPTLDVQAETRVREYQIQLGVSGTADRAVVTFLSEPPLSDSNILALLALGKTSEELKGKEANVGVGEATSFATGQFQDILESHARNLTGLDRFQVDPYINKTDTAVPRVTVGKEIMRDKLFLTYSSNVGASTPEQVFSIEYVLNKNISLVGDRDEVGNLGADVKFRFEFH